MVTIAIERLQDELSDVPVAPPGMLRAKSRDYYWFSPLLRAVLDDKRADIVFVPETRAELVRIAAACARHRVNLTMRGGGTGN